MLATHRGADEVSDQRIRPHAPATADNPRRGHRQ